jgi:ubiquinone/menaquinone biosynthesis C-methylase UbiE
MAQLVFDEAMVAQLEKLYATRDVLRRRRLVREALGPAPGERILDMGCGPGFYAAELLEAVGAEGSVVGVDVSAAMLDVARKRTEGSANADFREGEATALPVEDGEFDAALTVQVLEYVEDATAALRELHRALRPGGRLVVWDVDWATLSCHSEDPARMERVLRAWDGHLAHASLPRTLAPRLREAEFANVRAEGHSFATAWLDPESYGAALIPVVQKYVAGDEGIGADTAAAWAEEQRELGGRGAFYSAVIQFCFSAVKPG